MKRERAGACFVELLKKEPAAFEQLHRTLIGRFPETAHYFEDAEVLRSHILLMRGALRGALDGDDERARRWARSLGESHAARGVTPEMFEELRGLLVGIMSTHEEGDGEGSCAASFDVFLFQFIGLMMSAYIEGK